jgi:hypothetical protein
VLNQIWFNRKTRDKERVSITRDPGFYSRCRSGVSKKPNAAATKGDEMFGNHEPGPSMID